MRLLCRFLGFSVRRSGTAARDSATAPIRVRQPPAASAAGAGAGSAVAVATAPRAAAAAEAASGGASGRPMQVATLFRESTSLLGASMEAGGGAAGPGGMPAPVDPLGPTGPIAPIAYNDYNHPFANKYKL